VEPSDNSRGSGEENKKYLNKSIEEIEGFIEQ
jgi:hypothetical protein